MSHVRKIVALALAVVVTAGMVWGLGGFTKAKASGLVYYVSSSAGSDGNDGLSQAAPFKTIARVNELTLGAGDQVLFMKGDTWLGETLTPVGHGEEGNPIIIGSYGSGTAKPIINGSGHPEAVHIVKTSYITVQDLEIINDDTLPYQGDTDDFNPTTPPSPIDPATDAYLKLIPTLPSGNSSYLRVLTSGVTTDNQCSSSEQLTLTPGADYTLSANVEIDPNSDPAAFGTGQLRFRIMTPNGSAYWENGMMLDTKAKWDTYDGVWTEPTFANAGATLTDIATSTTVTSIGTDWVHIEMPFHCPDVGEDICAWGQNPVTVTDPSQVSAWQLQVQIHGQGEDYLIDDIKLAANSAPSAAINSDPDFSVNWAATKYDPAKTNVFTLIKDPNGSPSTPGDGDVRSGNSSLHMTWAAGDPSYTYHAFQYITPDPDTNYTFSVWVKGSGNFYMVADGAGSDPASTWGVLPGGNQPYTATDTWAQYSITFNSSDFARPLVGIKDDGPLDIYVDDATLTNDDAGAPVALTNPGFEEGTAGWQSWGNPLSIYTAVVTNPLKPIQDGANVLDMNGAAWSGGHLDPNTQVIADNLCWDISPGPIALVPGEEYTVNVWARGNGKLSLRLYNNCNICGADGTTDTIINNDGWNNTTELNFASTDDWTCYSYDFVAPAGTTSMGVELTKEDGNEYYIGEVDVLDSAHNQLCPDPFFTNGLWHSWGGFTIMDFQPAKSTLPEIRRGVYVEADNMDYNASGTPAAEQTDASGNTSAAYGAMLGVTLQNLDIHDVMGWAMHASDAGGYGNDAAWWRCGGIYIANGDHIRGVDADPADGGPIGHVDGMVIDNCYIHDVSTLGIYSNDYYTYYTTNQYCNTGALINNTIVRNTGGDGIAITDASWGFTVQNSGMYDIGYDRFGKGSWFCAAYVGNNSVWQNCEVGRVMGGGDSHAFDADLDSYGGGVIQYCYSHDCPGSFLMDWGGSGHGEAALVVRYNISVNDAWDKAGNLSVPDSAWGDMGHHLFLFDTDSNNYIYNNVFYNDLGQPIDMTGSGDAHTMFVNNVFVSNCAETTLDLSNWTQAFPATFNNNAYYNTTGADVVAAGYDYANSGLAFSDDNAIVGDPGFLGAPQGNAPAGDDMSAPGYANIITSAPLRDIQALCAGFQVGPDSPLAGAGVAVTKDEVNAFLTKTAPDSGDAAGMDKPWSLTLYDPDLFDAGAGFDFFGDTISAAAPSVGVYEVPVPVTGVTVDPDAATINKGDTLSLTATVEPDNATNQGVTWSSSDQSVATVDENGVVTAVGGGTATITCTTDDGGFTADCVVTVLVPVTGVTLSQTEVTLTSGASMTLVDNIQPADATNQSVVWTTSDPTVATVDQDGNITAVGLGTCTITCTTEDGGFIASCVVTVVEANPDTVYVISVTLDKNEITLNPGENQPLIATVLPEDATDKSVTWTTSDPAVATVDQNGVVTAVGVGDCTITVETTDGGKIAQCVVHVVNPPEPTTPPTEPPVTPPPAPRPAAKGPGAYIPSYPDSGLPFDNTAAGGINNGNSLYGNQAAAASALYDLGLLYGVGNTLDGNPDFALNQYMTRMEAITVVIRLLGLQQQAMDYAGPNPFTDAPSWGDRYAAYAYSIGLTVGVNAEHTLLDANAPVTFQQFTAFLMRALGYSDINGDYQYADVISAAADAGLFGVYGKSDINGEHFLRGSAVLEMVDALATHINGGNGTLFDKLVSDGAISQANAAKYNAIVNK